MPVRVYKCDRCKAVTQVQWVSGMQPKCKCGATPPLLKRVPFKPPVTPPVVKIEPPPTIPTAPPLPSLTAKTPKPVNPAHQKFIEAQKNFKPSGKSLLEELQASKVGVFDSETGARTINRTSLDNNAYQRYWAEARSQLPTKVDVVAGSQAEVSDVVRCVVNNVQAKSIHNVSIDFIFRGRKYYLANTVSIDLSLPLTEMASGKCRPFEHSNSNTTFGNRDQLLPIEVGTEDVSYLEFGWRYAVPNHLIKTSRNSRTNQTYRYTEVLDSNRKFVDNFGLQQDIAKFIMNNGGTLEAGLRLVISDWGYLFFTHTHYRSFYIYDPVNHKWVAYGETKNADESWYHSGEPNSNWILPIGAPNYW